MPKGDAKALKITGWLTGIYFIKEIQELLKDNFSVYFSTIQIERECFDKDLAKEIDINKG